MDEAQIRETSNLDCVRADPGIQKRVFSNWLQRAPDLAKYPLIICVHCEGDKLASYSDMVLLSDTIISHGGNVMFCRVPNKVVKPKAKPKDNFHTFFWDHLEKRTFEEKVWAPLRNHSMDTQYTAADPCNTTYTDPAWEMPSRVPAADPRTTGDPAAAADSSSASAPFKGADARSEEVTPEAEEPKPRDAAEIQRSYEAIREISRRVMEAPPEASAEKRREAVRQFSSVAREALEGSEALWENLPDPPKVFLRGQPAARQPPLRTIPEGAGEQGVTADAARQAGIAAREAADAAQGRTAAAEEPPCEE